MSTSPIPRLTSLTACAGCAAKLRPDLLGAALKTIPQKKNARALVGFETSDDAAVYKLNSTQAIVETVDFFPPIHDDPFMYGQIAAANAMSASRVLRCGLMPHNTVARDWSPTA